MVSKMATKRTRFLPSQGALWRQQGAMDTSCTGKYFISIEEKFFHSKNNQSLEQPPQGCGTVTGGFQDQADR